MATKAAIKASNKYNKEHTVSIQVRLNKSIDADILAKLGAVPSKMGYIKELIRKDIKVSEENKE